MKKYEKIINDIILKIQTGIFKEGEQLYTEKEIKEIYNVSSTTAVRVLNELESAGYIFRIQGKGSFVNKTLVNKKVFVTENNNFHKHFKESVSEHSEVVEAEIIQDKELCSKLKLKNQKLLISVMLLGLTKLTIFQLNIYLMLISMILTVSKSLLLWLEKNIV